MFTPRVIVDGADLQTTYGATLTGGWTSLFALPETKEPRQNDWHEVDGIEVDLEEGLKLAPRRIRLRFAFDGGRGGGFLCMRNHYRTQLFEIEGYGKIRLRGVSATAGKTIGGDVVTAYIDFVEDKPGEFEPDGGQTKEPFPSAVTIDGKPLPTFGATDYGETAETLLGGADAKEPLTLQSRAVDGQITPEPKGAARAIAISPREVAIKLLFIAPTGEDLRGALWAFLKEMTKPGERTIFHPALDGVIKGYYVGMECKDIAITYDWFLTCEVRFRRIN